MAIDLNASMKFGEGIHLCFLSACTQEELRLYVRRYYPLPTQWLDRDSYVDAVIERYRSAGDFPNG